MPRNRMVFLVLCELNTVDHFTKSKTWLNNVFCFRVCTLFRHATLQRTKTLKIIFQFIACSEATWSWVMGIIVWFTPHPLIQQAIQTPRSQTVQKIVWKVCCKRRACVSVILFCTEFFRSSSISWNSENCRSAKKLHACLLFKILNDFAILFRGGGHLSRYLLKLGLS